jgi:hypothetical protein
MAYLALAVSNWYLERSEPSLEWMRKADELQIDNWLFGTYFSLVSYQQMLDPEEVVKMASIDKQLTNVLDEINKLAEDSVFDNDLIDQMIAQVEELIKQKSENKK